MQARLPGVPDALGYGLYLCAGLLTWNYFVEVLLRTQTALVAFVPVLLIQQGFALIAEALFRRLSGPMVDEA